MDDDKIVFALSYMKGGTAGPWSKRKVKQWSALGQVGQTWLEFLEDFKSCFGDPYPAASARHKLGLLKQGNLTAEDYVAQFKEFMDETGYNDAALVEFFERGLSQPLLQRIYSLEKMPSDLQGWFHWAVKFDRQHRQLEARRSLTTLSSAAAPVPAPIEPAPKAVIPPTVAPKEVEPGWNISRNPVKVCHRCRKPGHLSKDCTSGSDFTSMDYAGMKAHFKQELEKDTGKTQDKDFPRNH